MGKQNISSNRISVVEQIGTSKIRRLQSFSAASITAALEELEGAEILKATPTTTVYKVPGQVTDVTNLCVKKYVYPSLLERLKAFITSRPSRAWTAGCRLRELGIPVIDVLAFVRNGTIPHTDYLFVTYLQDIVTLYDYSRTNSTPLSHSPVRAILRALAKALALLHQHRVYHNDLKGQNVLIDQPDSSSPRCIFCDLDSIMLWRRLSLRRIAKNLAQLNTSIPEEISNFSRIRFFLTYLQAMERSGQHLPKRPLLTHLVAISRKRQDRHRRRQQRQPQ